MRVIPTQFCQRCGTPLYGNVCPHCGTSGLPVATQPRRDNIAIWAIVGIVAAVVLEFAVSAALAYRYFFKRSLSNLAPQVILRHEGPVAPLDQLKGSGRIYIVQMGPHNAPYSLDQLAGWLKAKYQLDVEVLPPTGLNQSAWDPSRNQYVAELLYAQLKREHPDLAADPKAYLIGFTDADMYSVQYSWKSTFTLRDHHRAAVISADGMQDTPAERRTISDQAANQHLQKRLQRILLKDVAIEYWHLPLNNDPSSLLRQTLDPDVPAEDIYASDLDPMHTKWGQSESRPCVFLIYSVKDGLQPLPGDVVRSCSDLDNLPPDESREIFEVDLDLGLLIDRHTDFYLPDSIPIEFQRATRDGWHGPMGFGLSGSHSYDKYLGSDDGMATIDVIKDDGGRESLKREPSWLSSLSLNKYVDADYSGKRFELKWRKQPFEHFDLKSFDGALETYLPCDNNARCYEVGYRDPEGQELTFQRDNQRRLMRLISPGKQWLSFTYGPNHIAAIHDSHGRIVSYAYDDRNRLICVTYPSGEIFRYEYDDAQHLLTFSVASDATRAPRVLLRNTYENGRIASQTLPDGTIYKYSYYPVRAGTIKTAIVNTSDGATFMVDVHGGYSDIWEHGRQAIPPHTAQLQSQTIPGSSPKSR